MSSWRVRRSLAIAVAAIIGGALTFGSLQTSALAGEGGDAAQASAVTSPQSGDKARAAINSAVVALQKEYSAYVQAPEGKPLRTQCDYFTSSPNADVTEDAVADALGRSLGDTLQGDAYIKWQLLSAVPGKFSDKNAQRLLGNFTQHASLTPRPGATHASKLELDQAIRGKTMAAAANINQQLTTAVTQAAAQNKTPIEYLDELYGKLPASDVTIRAGFAEAYNRAEAGIDSDLSQKVIRATADWVNASPPAPQVASVRSVVSELLNLMGGPEKEGGKKAQADLPDAVDPTAVALVLSDDSARAPIVLDSCGADIYAVNSVVRNAVERRDQTGANTNANANANKNNNTANANSNAFPPSYFTSVSYNATQKRLVWAQEKVKFATRKEVQDLLKALENSAPGIKFQQAQ